MEDWAAFVSTASHGDEADLERDAEALIERLEAFGSKVSSMELSPAREEKSAAKPISSYVPKVTPPDRRCSPSPHSVASDARRCSIETSSCGGSSVASEERRVDGQLVSKRLYAHAKARQERAALDKENADRLAASSAAPHINPRSKSMQRSGSIGERLHQEAHSKVLRQEAVAAETKRREAESAKESDNDGHPAINEVSASMMRDRTGDVVDRLYAQAKTRGREQEQRQAAAAQEILAHSRPEISTGSQRIAAKLPDRHLPVQERLYAEASARQSQLSAASQASSGESFQPHISAHSRRLAEKANQGVSLEERLSRPHSKKELGPSSELMECVHAPVVNSKSEQLVHQRLIRQGIDARTPVEDRLYAEANKRPAVVEEPEHIPTINPNSERILNRRGLVAPLEQRLQQGIRNARAGVSDEAEQCKYQPALSKGSQKLLANKERLPVQQRLLEWGAKHTRTEGNPDLEDARFRFGPPKGSESPSMIPSPRERPLSDGSATPRTAAAPKQRTQTATKPTVAGEPKTPARSEPDRLPHGGVSTPHGGVNTPRGTSMGSGYGSRVIGSSKAVRSKSDKPVPGKSTPDISSRSREMPVKVARTSMKHLAGRLIHGVSPLITAIGQHIELQVGRVGCRRREVLS
ncbi:hypothetical protein AB1Y20_019048 [Prymnesium parvum]|uniref:Uncharacterized protein n=1 Tax=Prymnesium parvum TaxID=97485 RepID=A0AB34JU87_PRYPA